jgi:hypothetical protein
LGRVRDEGRVREEEREGWGVEREGWGKKCEGLERRLEESKESVLELSLM